MNHQRTRSRLVQRDEPQRAAVASHQPSSAWCSFDELELGLLPEDVWDVFELDDDTADPRPERGDFWGEVDRSKPLDVPRAITVVINKSWREEAKQVSVPVKKELFFRGLVPLILYANELILRDRTRLVSLMKSHKTGGTISGENIQWLRNLATQYRLADPESPPADEKLPTLMEYLLVRVDVNDAQTETDEDE